MLTNELGNYYFEDKFTSVSLGRSVRDKSMFTHYDVKDRPLRTKAI